MDNNSEVGAGQYPGMPGGMRGVRPEQEGSNLAKAFLSC